MYWKVLLAVLFFCSSVPAHSQVVPTAEKPGLPLSIGAGYSNFNTDWLGRISGTTVWIDWSFYRAPSFLNRLGIELEGRDLSYGITANLPLRYDTIGGGPIYKWRYRRFAPYGKFFLEYGNVDFPPFGNYSHDTRTVYAPGGGLDYRVSRSIWVRGDYEYQFWTNIF